MSLLIIYTLLTEANQYHVKKSNFLFLQEKLVSLTREKSKLDAEAQEAKAAQRRTEVEKLQLQLLNDNLANNNKWLEENLSQNMELIKSERQKTTQEVLVLPQTLFHSNCSA